MIIDFMADPKNTERGVLNLPTELHKAFVLWCTSGGRDIKVKMVTERLVRWFLSQEFPVQSLILNGMSAVPSETREAVAKSLTRTIIRQAEVEGAAAPAGMAARVVPTAPAHTPDHKGSESVSDGRGRHRKKAS